MREGRKLNVKWNKKRPVVKVDKFVSYLEYTTKTNMPITLNN